MVPARLFTPRGCTIHLGVKDKATAARKWCVSATVHAGQTVSKRWTYALIPDDHVVGAASLGGLVSRFSSA